MGVFFVEDLSRVCLDEKTGLRVQLKVLIRIGIEGGEEGKQQSER